MSYDAIKVGDEVTVFLVGDFNGCYFTGTVLHMPQASGECWVIEGQDAVHYVQTFAEIRKQKPTQAQPSTRGATS